MTEEQIRNALAGRSPDMIELMQWFAYAHLQDEYIRGFSQQCYDLAMNIVNDLPDSFTLQNGLSFLLAAKDAFVRAAVANQTARGIG